MSENSLEMSEEVQRILSSEKYASLDNDFDRAIAKGVLILEEQVAKLQSEILLHELKLIEHSVSLAGHNTSLFMQNVSIRSTLDLVKANSRSRNAILHEDSRAPGSDSTNGLFCFLLAIVCTILITAALFGYFVAKKAAAKTDAAEISAQITEIIIDKEARQFAPCAITFDCFVSARDLEANSFASRAILLASLADSVVCRLDSSIALISLRKRSFCSCRSSDSFAENSINASAVLFSETWLELCVRTTSGNVSMVFRNSLFNFFDLATSSEFWKKSWTDMNIV